MRIPYYQVNAFTRRTFGGNPAGVCLLEHWRDDELLQEIAAENDFAETAFLVSAGDHYQLRWFTPMIEVDLCGHATLASAIVLFLERRFSETEVRFKTRSGWLSAERRGEIIELDFPARPPMECAIPDKLLQALGGHPIKVLRARDYLVVYESQEEVAAVQPDIILITALDCLGVIVTSPGKDADFVSRFFAPRAGVLEDPVTGSSHSTLIPYWAERLGKSEMFARQISQRGGELHCRLAGDRVKIGGTGVVYCRGEIEVGAR